VSQLGHVQGRVRTADLWSIAHVHDMFLKTTNVTNFLHTYSLASTRES